MPHPACHGNGDDHCCYLGKDVDGTQRICEFLRIDDPRAIDPDTGVQRHFACGVFLDAKELAPSNMKSDNIWKRVESNPNYQTKVQTFLDSKNLGTCQSWKGVWRSDGNLHGQCCFEGWVWDANGNIIEEPII